MHSEPNIIVIQPEIDIISMKMLSVLGCDTTNVTYKVRRRLFGCCTESNQVTLTESLSEIESEDAQRSIQAWNFDFTTESPLPAGRYAWEQVRDCDVPLWYTSVDSFHNKHKCNPVESSEKCCDVAQSLNENVTSESKQKAECNRRNTLHLKHQRQNLVQTNIKGYTKVQKNRTVKRLCSKNNDLYFLRGHHRVANYFLRNQDESTIS